MFQTEVIIFIQSFATDFLTFFFKFWTEIGYIQWIIPITLIFLFGISFRTGYILMQAVLLGGLLVFFLKEIVALPRPDAVDLNIKLLGRDLPNPTHFAGMGAKSFFAALPGEVVQAIRARPFGEWGFPSGHTSNAMTLGGLVFMIHKKTWLRMMAVIPIIFVPFSRLYLGRHFLADILGGYIIGFFMVFFFYKFVYKSRWIKGLFEIRERLYFDLRTAILFFYLFILPVLLLFVPKIRPEFIAGLCGLNLGFFLVWIRGVPGDEGTALERILRVMIALALFYSTYLTLAKLSTLLFHTEPGAVGFIRICVTLVLLIWGSTELSIKLGLYKRKASN